MAQDNVRRRKFEPQKEKYQTDEKKSTKVKDPPKQDVIKPKYGPHVTFPHQRVWSRCVIICGLLLIVWFNTKDGKEVYFATQKEDIVIRSMNVDCSEDYRIELEKFPGCVPKRCSRIVSDKLVSASEADVLLKLAKNGFKFGGSDGGASILDLQSGALSLGSKFINIYALNNTKKIFNNSDFAIYKVVKTKIQNAVAHHFRIDVSKIYLTKPTFFSRITNASAKTVHDEYWHPHVDKDTYESFHYTSLLYLSDYGQDFGGGRFMYLDKNNVNNTVEPRKGRVSLFTSGKENLHAVEKVTSGTRFALTVSFTCDKKYATSDPSFENLNH